MSRHYRTSLTLRRTNKGDWNAARRYVEGVPEEVPIKCSLQPYGNGSSTISLPEGMKKQDVRMVFTKTPIITSDHLTTEDADTTKIKGQEYYAKSSMDWDEGSPMTNHYEVMFVRLDKAQVVV